MHSVAGPQKSGSLTGRRRKTHCPTACKGKLTARERVLLLLDEGSFEELGVNLCCTAAGILDWTKEYYLGDGVVTGYGTIRGRLVYVFFSGLYGLWRIPVRNACRKIAKDHGPGHEERLR